MDKRIQDLLDQSEHLFQKKLGVDGLHQEIADNFYVERADFTMSRSIGQDIAGHLSTSYPMLARRELGNAFSSMLRPSGEEWFQITVEEERLDNESKRWLEWASGVQRRAMYDRNARLVTATKQGDHDFSAFGQCVLSAELNRHANGLLHRNWHLRDMAWCENAEGAVDTIHRKWRPTARDLNTVFRGNLSSKTKEHLEKKPYTEIPVRHVIVPGEYHEPPAGKKRWKTPYVSIYFELDSGHILEETPRYDPYYIIPRWQTVSGSQYAYSPATICALPDARLIQAMTLTLLEAGEKAVDPPYVAKREILREDLNSFAGGLTYVDLEEDERIADVLQALPHDSSGIPIGMEMRADAREMISQAFFLNKLNLPIMAGDMTATEVSQRVQEYIRSALPLFEPMEPEYNGALCEQTFGLLLRGGGFGDPRDIPPRLRGADIQFRFKNPLREASEKQMAQSFLQAKALLADAVALDPGATAMIDARLALRDALTGVGVPAKWIRDEKQMQAIDIETQKRQQAQEMLATIQQGATAAKTAGEAGQAIQNIQGFA